MSVYLTRTDFVMGSLNLNEPSAKTILDVGFIGEYKEPFIHNAIKGAMGEDHCLIGLDLSDKIDDFTNTGNVTYQKKSIFDIDDGKLDARVDAVVLCEVFEHLYTPFLSLHKIYAVLKPGGKLIMTYPNPLSMRIFIRYLFQKEVTNRDFISIYNGAPDHKVFPMPPSMIKYLQDIGFIVKELHYLKGKFPRHRILKKFSPYIGIMAAKKGC